MRAPLCCFPTYIVLQNHGVWLGLRGKKWIDVHMCTWCFVNNVNAFNWASKEKKLKS